MNEVHRGLRTRTLATAAVLAAVATLSACGSSDESSTSSGSTSAAAPTTTAAAKSDKPVKIAYLSFAVANSYDAPMLAAAKEVADQNNASITVFDANNDPKKQFSQLQNAASSNQYDAIMTQPIFGTGLITGVQDAISNGIKVVNFDQILGEDLTTDQAQVEGLSGNVVFVPSDIGTKMGKLAVDACASKNLDPCNVGYLYSIKASALDGQLRKSFDAAVAGSPVKVVGEGEGFYTPALGLKATQNLLQAQPDIDLIVGADQSIEGAVQALPKDSDVLLVGYGGSVAAVNGVKSGQWFGDVAQAPASEGRLATEAAIAAVREDKVSPGENPVAQLPAGGVITKDNADQFNPEWPG